MPRGARIAETLDLDIDPDSERARRAIDVYPHPVTVALFRLGCTLKEKQKKGGTLDFLKSELLRFIELIEGLADAEVSMRVIEIPTALGCADWSRTRRRR